MASSGKGPGKKKGVVRQMSSQFEDLAMERARTAEDEVQPHACLPIV